MPKKRRTISDVVEILPVIGPPSPFEEYRVTPEEVERAAERDLAAIRRERKAGKLKTWQIRGH